MQRTMTAGLDLADDGRTLTGRFIPFGEVAVVSDGGPLYREGFRAGSLTRLVQVVARRGNAGFIRLNLDHGDDLHRQIGFASSIDQRDDGGYGTFRLYESHDLPKVQSMLRESHTGLSVEFTDRAPAVVVDGVVWRTQVNVDGVAATPVPSYAGAVITGMRSDDDADDEDMPALRELHAYLRAIGAEVHTTDDADTESGTPDDEAGTPAPTADAD